METNILATAAALSDRELLTRLAALAGKEREASVALVAHLAALDTRPAVYAAQGYGSLFSYCIQALRLSEDAAWNRIAAARACRAFPAVLDLLASGSMSLTAVRLLGPHLTPENYKVVLAKAKGRSRREIDALIAELAPRPDVPVSVRRLPAPTIAPTSTACSPAIPISTATSVPSEAAPAAAPSPAVFVPMRRPIVQATAPERYRVQFTIGEETHDKLRRVQSLLRREIPNGDAGAIFDRALTLLLERVEKAKLGAAVQPRPSGSTRSGTDRVHKSARPSRHIPREVKRVVWQRDGGQCAFVAPAGRRCTERTFLEYHHVQPFARQGLATIDNISLRCWRHNHHEGDLIFGPHRAKFVRENSSSPAPGAR